MRRQREFHCRVRIHGAGSATERFHRAIEHGPDAGHVPDVLVHREPNACPWRWRGNFQLAQDGLPVSAEAGQQCHPSRLQGSPEQGFPAIRPEQDLRAASDIREPACLFGKLAFVLHRNQVVASAALVRVRGAVPAEVGEARTQPESQGSDAPSHQAVLVEAPLLDTWIGFSTVKAILANRIAPGLIDRYLAKAGHSGQLTNEPAPADTPSNLFHPVPGPYAAHGRFDQRARDRGWDVFTSRHRNALWGTVTVAAVLGLHQLAKRLDI